MSTQRNKKIMFEKPNLDIVASPYIKKALITDNDYAVSDSLIKIATSRNVILPSLVKSSSTQKHETSDTNKTLNFSALRPKGKRIFYEKRFTENMMVDPAIHHPTSLNVGNYY
jgi:hypothetical protein